MNEILIKNISKNYKNTKALNNINLNIEENKIYGLLGRNGAGKSTLINLINNKIFPTEGKILINNHDFNTDKAQSLIFSMNDKDFYPGSLKVEKLLHYTSKFYSEFDYQKSLDYSKIFGLDINKKYKELSTGYKTIMKFIIALSLNLKYIFLDEPVLGLDANHRELFYKVLIENYQENPRTLVIATHLIEEVSNIIEHVILINDGEVILNENIYDVLNKGYSVSGSIKDVDEYSLNKNVIGNDILGGYKINYIIGVPNKKEIKNSLELSKINLQKLFVKLTSKGDKNEN